MTTWASTKSRRSASGGSITDLSVDVLITHPDVSQLSATLIGTGATGVQVIQEVAKTAGHLTVFQRHPNWCAPLHNRKITDEEWVDIRARQGDLVTAAHPAGPAGSPHGEALGRKDGSPEG